MPVKREEAVIGSEQPIWEWGMGQNDPTQRARMRIALKQVRLSTDRQFASGYAPLILAKWIYSKGAQRGMAEKGRFQVELFARHRTCQGQEPLHGWQIGLAIAQGGEQGSR